MAGTTNQLSVERIAVASVVTGVASLIAYVGLRALPLPLVLAAGAAVVFGAAGGVWLARGLPPTFDGLRTRRPRLCALWLLLAALSLAQTARVSSFMIDPARAQHSLMPWDAWLVEHSCLTAYTEGLRFTREGRPNIYDPQLYGKRDRLIGRFKVDLYHYPPSFLLLPRALEAVVGPEYPPIRAAWFALSGMVLLLALGLLARRAEPAAQLRHIFVAPVIWLALPTQVALQMSNVQVLVLAVAMIAMVMLAQASTAARALGGALLALTIVSKLFPGILLLYLAAQRRWRDLIVTAGFVVSFCALALAVFGTQPFAAFVDYELPRLSSGEAFKQPLANVFPTARNMSPFGIAIKLDRLGVPGMGFGMGRIFGIVFGLGVLALAFWAGRARPRSASEQSAIWIALLGLASLGSPFAPANYVLLAVIWLTFLHPQLCRPFPATLVWLAIGLPFLIPRGAPFVPQLLGYLPAQLLALLLPAAILWRAGQAPARAPESQLAAASPA